MSPSEITPTFKAGTKHTLILNGLQLSSQVTFDSLRAKANVVFRYKGKNRVVGSKLITLTHEPLHQQIECQIPQVYKKGHKFEVSIEFEHGIKNLVSALDNCCCPVNVEKAK